MQDSPKPADNDNNLNSTEKPTMTCTSPVIQQSQPMNLEKLNTGAPILINSKISEDMSNVDNSDVNCNLAGMVPDQEVNAQDYARDNEDEVREKENVMENGENKHLNGSNCHVEVSSCTKKVALTPMATQDLKKRFGEMVKQQNQEEEDNRDNQVEIEEKVNSEEEEEAELMASREDNEIQMEEESHKDVIVENMETCKEEQIKFSEDEKLESDKVNEAYTRSMFGIDVQANSGRALLNDKKEEVEEQRIMVEGEDLVDKVVQRKIIEENVIVMDSNTKSDNEIEVNVEELKVKVESVEEDLKIEEEVPIQTTEIQRQVVEEIQVKEIQNEKVEEIESKEIEKEITEEVEIKVEPEQIKEEEIQIEVEKVENIIEDQEILENPEPVVEEEQKVVEDEEESVENNELIEIVTTMEELLPGTVINGEDDEEESVEAEVEIVKPVVTVETKPEIKKVPAKIQPRLMSNLMSNLEQDSAENSAKEDDEGDDDNQEVVKSVSEAQAIEEDDDEESALNSPIKQSLTTERNLNISEDESSKEYTMNGENEVLIWGSGECDQFTCEQFESKRPIQVPYFSSNNIKVAQITCGSQHSLILDSHGKVHSWGNSDDGALGRYVPDNSSGDVPDLVDLDEQVDMISAGEAHSVMANSQTGKVFFTGVIKSTNGKLSEVFEIPELVGGNQFRKQGIRQIVSGSNHVLILTGSKLYSFGDNSCGALGHLLRNYDPKDGCMEPNALRLKSVSKVFSGANHSFAITKRNRVMAWGLNSTGQLGMAYYMDKGEDSDVNNEDPARNPNVLQLPHMVLGITADEVQDIVGGEHHTLVLTKDGRVLGAGRNDDGQLGLLEIPDRESYPECQTPNQRVKVAGTNNYIVVTDDYMPNKFHEIPMAKKFQKIHSCAHYNYGINTEEKEWPKVYTWGSGFNYVLGNGKEDALQTPFRVSNEKLFKGKLPTELALGYSHVVYYTGDTHEIELEEVKGRHSARAKRNIPLDEQDDRKKMKDN